MTPGRVLRAAIGVVAPLVVALLVVACSPGTAATPGPATTGVTPTPMTSGSAAEQVRVALGIYSGRPDPEWTLTAGQVAVLDAEMAMLPGASGTPPSGGLGYHGFTVTRPGSTVIVYRGTVAAPGEGDRPYRFDTGHVIERLLLETGRSHLAPAEVAEVEQALRQ